MANIRATGAEHISKEGIFSVRALFSPMRMLRRFVCWVKFSWLCVFLFACVCMCVHVQEWCICRTLCFPPSPSLSNTKVIVQANLHRQKLGYHPRSTRIPCEWVGELPPLVTHVGVWLPCSRSNLCSFIPSLSHEQLL
ncbi:hypothetical protein BDU57DRAFT_524213, partial [Ampelomyces quisqualis]